MGSSRTLGVVLNNDSMAIQHLDFRDRITIQCSKFEVIVRPQQRGYDSEGTAASFKVIFLEGKLNTNYHILNAVELQPPPLLLYCFNRQVLMSVN